ncbi:MAG: hypothetical protein K8T25_13845 [Planctomycetia bacterium]|nr:hypothetical protein [Planctomycetia bacterium]
MRASRFILGLCIVAAGCARDDAPALDVEVARAALIDRINSDREGFSAYGTMEQLEAFRRSPAKAEPNAGQYHLAAKETAGPMRLSGFHVDVKNRKYHAAQYAPFGKSDEKVGYFPIYTWKGVFSLDKVTNTWVASDPKRVTMEDAPK